MCVRVSFSLGNTRTDVTEKCGKKCMETLKVLENLENFTLIYLCFCFFFLFFNFSIFFPKERTQQGLPCGKKTFDSLEYCVVTCRIPGSLPRAVRRS